MTGRLNMMGLVLIVVLTIFGGAFLSSIHTASSAQTQSDDSLMRNKQWEYCSVVPVNQVILERHIGTATINYFRDGDSTEYVRASVSNGPNLIARARAAAFAKAITKLGNEGWELVGEGASLNNDGHEQNVLYFKRAARQFRQN